VPDPQDPATFERSKLRRAEEQPPGISQLYAELLRARRALPPGAADEVTYDEHAGWLRVVRGAYTLVANFSGARAHVPVDGTVEPVVTTHHTTLEPGFVVLPPLAGALVR
jgi:maltooligosyltrehalose trehalohydrolase